jgi:hypothetical protein
VPTRLCKEVDAVLQLQAEVDRVVGAISFTREVIRLAGITTPEVQTTLGSLEALNTKLRDDVDHLYSSLDVPQRFLSLKGASLDFVRVLFLARDLKINICKRAIASLFEWERLDQAAGGRAQPLGTSKIKYVNCC